MTPKQEARLYNRAIKSRWDIPSDVKTTVVETLRDIAQGSEKDSARVAACNALLSAEAQNQRDEHKVADIAVAKRNGELAAIAADLGIEISAVEDAQGSGGGSIEDVD